RTSLARILALLDSGGLPGADVHGLIDHARARVEHAGALLGYIVSLIQLESVREIGSLGHTTAFPVLENVIDGLSASAARAGVTLAVEGDPSIEVPLRPRMLKIVAQNLGENAVRYSGHGTHFSFTVQRAG